MDNKSLSRRLRLLGQLLELHEENSFKVKAAANAAFKVDKLPFPAASRTQAELEAVEGIGKTTAARIHELVSTQHLAELDALLLKTPPGVVDMLSIKGLGPKKVYTIWHDLGLESVGELLYACMENRLIEAKGFGLKNQEDIRKAIEFSMAGSGKFLFARVEAFAHQLQEHVKEVWPGTEVSVTGEFRRACEVLETVDLLVASTADQREVLQTTIGMDVTAIDSTTLTATSAQGVRVVIHQCEPEKFGTRLFETTGSKEHVRVITELAGSSSSPIFNSEVELYAAAGWPWIPPELREDHLVEKPDTLPQLITFDDLKGALHNHSTWSDGVHTLEEMAFYCRDALQLQYFGICDHSKTAVYARGLSEERVIAQQKEIDQLNAKMAPFRIFKGIESDILPDGSLDYPDELLATFDFVVASVHSAFKMSEEKATDRLITAIENPYTTILGHPTGRLLLSRAGYPIDFKKVIDACAANQVVIELNANPLRLDLDWRWHRYAIEKGVLLSINPDAHRTDGFHDMRYGVFAARKGGMEAGNCLNAMSLEEITTFFTTRRQTR